MKRFFSKFLSDPKRLHFAAHSHHPWPDVTFTAQQQAWHDAARFIDDKWDHVFSTVWPEAAQHVATELKLPDPSSLAFAPNTHEFVLRLLSCLPTGARVLSSDSEFHSFERQSRRLEETGALEVRRVPAGDARGFGQRLIDEAGKFRPHLVFFSQVFFNSGGIVERLEELVAELASVLPAEALIVIDGYHGFCAVPTDLSRVGQRAFYVAGGYKYAMAGEGACFLHVPPSHGQLRPPNTGWFAAFGALQNKQDSVPYADKGARFTGATFDPSGLYRLNSVMRWRNEEGLTTAKVRTWAHTLQRQFLTGLRGRLSTLELVVPLENEARGQFLTFRTADAKSLCAQLKQLHVDTDARDDRLRFGFGIYQDQGDVERLLARCATL